MQLSAILALAMAGSVASECANACNGHGKCTSYDMCICNRNWQANDCSERVCPYGLAHVDTPKGDLNHDNAISDSDSPIIENNFVFPYGTTEMFPQMRDSDLQELTNTAHYYQECSNKGTCDRESGECECYPGYDGASCQRASCPGFPASCSGHGVCKNIQQLANADTWNTYELWDRHSTMGCECDAGYYGADCSSRKCKTGVDPLYTDDSATIKYPIMNFATLTTLAGATQNLFYDGMAVGTTDSDRGKGKWAIRFFDSNGEDWLTESMDAGTSCANVIKALEALPNNVIPVGTTKCSTLSTHETLNGNLASFTLKEDDYQVSGKERDIVAKIAFWEGVADQKDTATVASSTVGLPNSYDSTASNVIPMSGYIYRIKFFGNPGALKQPEIETMLDGDRSSLMATDFSLSSTTTARTITSVWTDGQQGEDNDYIADHCNGVQFTVAKLDNTDGTTDATLPSRMIHYLKSLTTAELALLKTCLGSSDNTQANNVESYDWDYGTYEFPHLVKIVRSQTTYTDGGHYAALIWRQARSTVGSDGYATSTSETDSNFFQSGWFELINPWYPLDADVSNIYEMYTTKGTLKLTAEKANAYFGFGSKTIFTYNTEKHFEEISGAGAGAASTYDSYSGSVACEVNNKCDDETDASCTTATKYRSEKTGYADDQTNFEKNSINECLEKGHMFTFLSIYDDTDDLTSLGKKIGYNPPAINLYTATRLRTADASATWKDAHGVATAGPAGDATDSTARQTEMEEQKSQMWRHQINTDLSVNWASAPASGISAATGDFRLYKFTPADASTYNYVGECSNRGLCDSSVALCECFPGYSGDNCAQQNSLAV